MPWGRDDGPTWALRPRIAAPIGSSGRGTPVPSGPFRFLPPGTVRLPSGARWRSGHNGPEPASAAPMGRAPASPVEGPSRLGDRPMGRYTGPKVRKSKRVRAPICDTAKHHKADLDRGPGVHGFSRRRKLTIYGERLREKQKLAFFYHVNGKQMKRYMAEAKRSRSNTGDKLAELLERRLDNVVRRAGFCRTIWQARQVVVHGHIHGQRQARRPSELAGQARRQDQRARQEPEGRHRDGRVGGRRQHHPRLAEGGRPGSARSRVRTRAGSDLPSLRDEHALRCRVHGLEPNPLGGNGPPAAFDSEAPACSARGRFSVLP